MVWGAVMRPVPFDCVSRVSRGRGRITGTGKLIRF